jgi:hypothetical protein
MARALGRERVNEDSKERWAVLVKFGRRDYLEQLRNAGSVYMNPQCYFSKLEAVDPVRGDQFEGSDKIFQSNALKRLVIQKNVDASKLVIRPSRLWLSLGKSSCNIYCMFAVLDPANFRVDERNFGFGDSFVMVTDQQMFGDRFSVAAKAAHLDLLYNFVEYYDPTIFSGDTGPFRKPATFAYQNEFRFVVTPGSRDAIVLQLGSLLDITTDIYPSAEINRLIEFPSGPTPD